MTPTCGEISGSGQRVRTPVASWASSAAISEAIANKLKNTLRTRYHRGSCSGAQAIGMTKNSGAAAARCAYIGNRQSMRAALAVLIVLVIAAGAAAQTIGLPLPSIGLPLPQIGLPLPPTGLPPLHSTARPPARTPPPANAHRPPANTRPARGPRTIAYFVPAFGWEGFGAPLPEPPPAPVAPATGRLLVELQPDVDPQVFIDGYFVGTLDDTGGDLPLEPGVHRLDLRADGYEPLAVEVQIVADRSTRYRASLVRGSALPDNALGGIGPTARDSTPPPATIYMIPGCYIGNMPPQQISLPAGCDPARVSVFPSRR
jgi:hypothetical protein